jgi:hypothetical protein
MENSMKFEKSVLICKNISKEIKETEKFDSLIKNFCGKVFYDNTVYKENMTVYACGDVSEIEYEDIKVIKDFSTNFTDSHTLVSIDEVPVNIHNAGVYFKKFFSSEKNYFDELEKSHNFQDLTESNKPGKSYRKGIYLSEVKEKDDVLHFNLLRCSTNLGGPTDNFRNIDREIVDKVNKMSKYFFDEKVELNHVLAQIYNNYTVDQKEKKAKIKGHADKTKDMPPNGLMAFCTFYKELPIDSKNDYMYKNNSVLTKLRFKLKLPEKYPDLVERFDITLYPNSVFLMSLDTNRIYTHEIVPSSLPIDKIPIRLGYVIRCSKTEAVFKDDNTYIVTDNKYVKLEKPTESDITELKKMYAEENYSDNIVEYGNVYYSLNDGDYVKPIK